MLFVVTSLALLSTTATGDRWYVTRAEAIARAEPSGESAEVTRLPVGAGVDVAGRKGRWIKVRLAEGKSGWLLRSQVGRRMPSRRQLCARGRSQASAGHLANAVAYLKLAMDRGTRDRPCLEALALAYRARGQGAEEAAVRARIRRIESWAVGLWCNALQTIELSLSEDGSYTLKNGGKLVGGGKYELHADELHLLPDTRAPTLRLILKKRGLGNVLVAQSTDELLRDFCPPVQ
jgi:hypothetical protein